MELFPFVAAFATFCFVWSYGIQNRRWWAWHLGWGFGVLVATAIVYVTIVAFLYTQTWPQLAVNLLYPTGATCVWIFWARWWARHRSEFYPEERRRKRGEGGEGEE